MKILFLKRFITFCLLLLLSVTTFAQDKDFPERPSPERLVNDFAGMMRSDQQQALEQALVAYDKESSTQIAIVTVQSLNDHDIAEYATTLAQKWGIGQKGKNNGVLILASSGDRKMWIATGYGMEGVLPDGLVGRIVRNEMVPEFKTGNYYQGFKNAVVAIQEASKGEYTNENPDDDKGGGAGLIVLVIIVIIIIAVIKGGGGGGNYMSRRGGDFITGAILGNLLGGGGRGGWGGGSGGSSGGGGFGGFGGGGFGGGGAGSSW